MKSMVLSEMVVAEPLVLRLHWWGSNQEIFLQRVDMLWTKALGDTAARAEYQASTKLSRYGAKIQEGLTAYVAGEAVDWRTVCADMPLFWRGMPPFRKRVLQTLYDEVGYGRTIRYGELAALSGSSKAARAVGSAMSANPWPLIVP